MDKKTPKITLTLEERQQIEKLLKKGFRNCEIARNLGRSPSVIHYEITRSGGFINYEANHAQELSDKRRSAQMAKYRWDGVQETKELIISLRKQGKSVNFIANQLQVNCHTLSKFIKRHELGGDIIEERIEALEMQIQIIIEQLEKMNVRN